jgi:hypothetical protein
MRNLCFTERPLQFSEIAHKSFGSLFSLSPLFLFSLASPSFFFHRRRSFSPTSLPLLHAAAGRASELRPYGIGRQPRRAGAGGGRAARGARGAGWRFRLRDRWRAGGAQEQRGSARARKRSARAARWHGAALEAWALRIQAEAAHTRQSGGGSGAGARSGAGLKRYTGERQRLQAAGSAGPGSRKERADGVRQAARGSETVQGGSGGVELGLAAGGARAAQARTRERARVEQ